MTRAAWTALVNPSSVKLPKGKRRDVRRSAPLVVASVRPPIRAAREALRSPNGLVLSWPPSVNNYWRATVVGFGKPPKFYISERGRAFRREVYVEARRQVMPTFGSALIAIEVDAYPRDAKGRDLDNILKSLLDALQHAGCYDDDRQVQDLHVRMCRKGYDGAVVVRMRALETKEGACSSR